MLLKVLKLFVRSRGKTEILFSIDVFAIMYFFLFLSSFVKKENNDEDLVHDLHRHHVLPAGVTVRRLSQQVKVSFMLFIATAQRHNMI